MPDGWEAAAGRRCICAAIPFQLPRGSLCCYLYGDTSHPKDKEVFFMKGYVVAAGYMGYVNGEYMLFSNEDDYREYFED